MDGETSELDTSPAVTTVAVDEKVGWFRRDLVPREFGYLEWTVDGIPLRDVVALAEREALDEVTPIRNEVASREYEEHYLRAVLGEPARVPGMVMPDGRVPLLVCRTDFDIDCGALSAEVVRGDRVVEWRDVAWQVGYAPLDLAEQEQRVVTLVFDRRRYDEVLRTLLSRVGRD